MSIIYGIIIVAIVYVVRKSQKRDIPIVMEREKTITVVRPPNNFQDFDPKAVEDLRLKFEEAGLTEHWEECKPYLKNEILIDITSAEEKDFVLGESKIGGKPDLPIGTNWFKDDNGNYLDFLAQFNLEDIAAFDIEKLLPPKGMLYFFYDEKQASWGNEPDDKDKFKVFFYDEDLSQLSVTLHPDKIKDHPYFKLCKLSFKTSLMLPEDLFGLTENIYGNKLKEENLEKYYKFLKAIENPNLKYIDSNTKLLGYPNVIQNRMEEDCERAIQGFKYSTPFALMGIKYESIKKNTYDWTLLFQLASVDEAEMMWGDCGNLYFWIKKEDLKNQNFENCWQILQCT